MKRVISFLVCLILLPSAFAVLIDVEVTKSLQGSFAYLEYQQNNGLAKFETEFYNTGSIPFTARVRLDIYNDSEKIFSTWSKEKMFAPGDRKVFELKCCFGLYGNFTASIRSYFGNEIIEEKVNFSKEYSLSIEAFRIENFRAYKNFAVFDLISQIDISNAVVLPVDFPLSWIVEQDSINNIKAGQRKIVVINYEPDVWPRQTAKILIASDDGVYFGSSVVNLRRQTGVLGALNYLLDLHRFAFNRLFG